MRILFLESFYGGSHKDFALGLKEHSKHEIEILSLPDRNWKWRMRCAGLFFTRQIKDIDSYDLIFATDMMNLNDFKAFVQPGATPVILYFHENQLTYPQPQKRKKDNKVKTKNDLQFGFTNIMSALSADRVLFNSNFQFKAFMDKLGKMIGIVPDVKPDWVLDDIKGKSGVLYPGCRFPKSEIKLWDESTSEPPVIVWNHRWEWDKNPDDFFSVLKKIKQKGISFRLSLLGERYGEVPDNFKKAEKDFSDELINFGCVESKKEYFDILKKGSIIVSTSIQENFGISVVEAVKMGCLPVLPARLSYPEIIPQKYHNLILYSCNSELEMKLEDALINYSKHRKARQELSSFMDKYSWKSMIGRYDMEFENILAKI